MVLQTTILTCKAILGREQTGIIRWISVWIMPQVQDRSMDLLTGSPALYHCATTSHVTVYDANTHNTLITLTIYSSWNTFISEVTITADDLTEANVK